MHNPKFNISSLLAISCVMWILTFLLWWVYMQRHNNIAVPIILTVFAICATGMYLNETK